MNPSSGALALRGGPGLLVRLVGALVCVAVVGFIVSSSFVLSDGRRYFSLADDAMISMRYAWNLAHGHGLVWNPNERVEGYTNPLLTLVMSLLCLLLDEKRHAVLGVQVLEGVALLGLAHVLSRLTAEFAAERSAKVRSWLVALTFVWVCLHYPLVGWALSGGEITLQALALSGAALAIERSRRQGSLVPFAAAGALGAGAYLARPDTIIGVAALWLLWVPELLRSPRRVALACGPVLGCVLFHLLFRHSYYGAWVPNTYSLKVSGIPLDVRLHNGFVYTLPYLVKALPIAALAAIGIASSEERVLARWSLLLALPALAAYQILVGGDAFPGWRMLIPGLLLMLPPALLGVTRLASAMAEWRGGNQQGWLVAGVVVATLFWLVLPDLGERHRTELFSKGYYGSEPPPRLQDLYPDDDVTFAAHNRTNVQTAVALSELLEPSARIGVFWAGAIPYYVDQAAVDFLGKSDSEIAHLAPDLHDAPTWFGMTTIPGHNKYDLRRSLQRGELDYLQHDRYGHDDLRAALRGEYEWVKYAGVWLLLRRGSPRVAWDRITAAAGHGGLIGQR